jgi:hypothetical protein
MQSDGYYFLGLLARLKIVANRPSSAGAAHWLARNDTLESAIVNVARHSQSAGRPIRRLNDRPGIPVVLMTGSTTATDHFGKREVLFRWPSAAYYLKEVKTA